MADTATYRTIWRWHFYAGLFVLPFVLLLSVSGAIYLFKPQIDRWEERDYRGLSPEGAVSADRQLEAVKTAFPDGSFNHYRLPERPGDAAMVQMTLPDGAPAEIYVSPQGQVLGTLDPAQRISNTISRFHGSLMLGDWGDRLVELAASWTVVMILSGLYLWWPRPFRAAGTLWPRRSLKGRALMKDLHRVIGFWLAGSVLVMLASGLPWAGAWGSAFKWARGELGLIEGPQDWKIGAEKPVAHDHGAMAHTSPPRPQAPAESLRLSAFVARAEAERMAFPVLVLPPHAPQRFGPPTGEVWTVKSEAQNRPLMRTVTFDPQTGEEVSRSTFADKHPIDRAINVGIAWHEGALFGLANQIMGLIIALALIALSVLGVLMWLKRRPTGKLAAPPRGGRLPRELIAVVAVLAILLPLFGVSLVAILLAEKAGAVLARR
ncbi:PepSY domain-containing protein [Erythrobacter sp. YJ-T3-07]|uniref:PepSY-associated TM helix domain-containing protein n=1 Tax=Erythrobacter sp. YJ-T3-07 TaxID=2793063 RepID=UPI0018D3AD0D|nr:PepSY domain-containing protein [Erythrobacter sp. YJ-T3-07]MBH1945426.1 PepSY domain-containing protein [Erythrobacter sp. YJ-T3-07]